MLGSEFTSKHLMVTTVVIWSLILISKVIASNYELNKAKADMSVNNFNGWSIKNIEKLKSKCQEGFDEGLMSKELEMNQDEFCKCLIEKTIKNISWQEFLEHPESVEKLQIENGRNCKIKVGISNLNGWSPKDIKELKLYCLEEFTDSSFTKEEESRAVAYCECLIEKTIKEHTLEEFNQYPEKVSDSQMKNHKICLKLAIEKPH